MTDSRRSWALVALTAVFFTVGCQSLSAQITRAFAEPYDQSEVATNEPGVLKQVFVREGETVKKGDVLAEMECEALKHSLRLAQLRAKSMSRVRSAEALMTIRKRQKDALQPLLDSGHANANEVEKAVAEYEASVAEFELAKEEVLASQIEADRISAQLDQRRIRSPIDGVITQIHCRPGEFIPQTAPRFATVVNLSKLRVRVYLTQEMVSSLSVEDTVPLKVYGKSKPVDAEVEFVSPVTDPQSGTARVDLVLSNRDLSIRSGSVCSIAESGTTLEVSEANAASSIEGASP